MTYLELVNNVLRRLREDEVSAVSETTYSTLVGDLVNDAKRQVEDTWNWSALRTDIVVPTVASTATYSLTGTGTRATINDARNLTSLWWMRPQTPMWGRAQGLTSLPTGAPVWYIPGGVDSNGDTTITLYPTPDGVYSISFNAFVRTDDITTDGEVIAIPTQPIIQLAWAMAAREKGEVGGQTSAEIFGLAGRALSDAVAYDSAKNPTETVFYEV